MFSTGRASGICTVVLVFLCVAVFFFPVAATTDNAPIALSLSEPLRHGDIVLRQGTGVWSGLFARLNPRDQRFSHIGIAVREGGQWYVVHAEADDLGRDGRVRLDDWNTFTAGMKRLAVLRLDREAAASRAAEAALDMYRSGTAFDFNFDLARNDAVYCTELVWRSLVQALSRDPLPVKPVVNGREVVLVENFLLDMEDLVLVISN